MFIDTKLSPDVNSSLVEKFEARIKHKSFPCVGAKSALARHRMHFLTVGDIRCARDDKAIYDSLRDFVTSYRAAPGPFQSLVVIFETTSILNEEEFETAMWDRLQSLETLDFRAGFKYDPRVSAEVTDPNFSLSFAEEAFFVVGLHPAASRPARAFDAPALVFNAHDQFEALRSEGRYETLRDSIIQRDIVLAGMPNPMLARYGETSEAIQYSGRYVPDSWTCPFHRVHE